MQRLRRTLWHLAEPEPAAAEALADGVLLTSGPLPAVWIHGAAHEPSLQFHRLDAGTFIIRFSKWLAGERVGTADEGAFEGAFEGNFVFLFVGSERAILFDTGPIPWPPLKAAIEAALGPSAASLDLIVAHTHSHGDHVQGDALWAEEAAGSSSPFRSVFIVGHSPAEVAQFYGLEDAEDEATGRYELGGRTLRLFWIRGHEDSALAIYDASTHVLVTGDNLYPGRLYVRDTVQFGSSCQRLAAFVRALQSGAEPLRVLGCHIEMSADGGEYPTGTLYQPDEAAYAMGAEDVLALGETNGEDNSHDTARRFIVVPPPP